MTILCRLLRGGRENTLNRDSSSYGGGEGGEVSGIALSTEGAGDARTTEDFNGFQLLFRNVPAPTLFVRG